VAFAKVCLSIHRLTLLPHTHTNTFAQAAKLATSEREKAEKAAEAARKAAIKAILAKRDKAFKEAEREKVCAVSFPSYHIGWRLDMRRGGPAERSGWTLKMMASFRGFWDSVDGRADLLLFRLAFPPPFHISTNRVR
jgi:hypothetical protein